MTKKKPYLYDILLDGEDEIGTYEGKGSIVCKKSGLFLWFFKEYDHHVNAYKKNVFKDMIFRTSSITNDEIKGRWHYHDIKGSGTWHIKDSEIKNLET